MDLLFVSVKTPGPADLRTARLISGLGKRGHRVTLVCGTTTQDSAHLQELRRIGVQIHTVPMPPAGFITALRTAPTELPLAASAAVHPRMIAAVQAVARTLPDAVAHLVGLAAAPLGVALRRLPAVLDLGHCASLSHLRTLQQQQPIAPADASTYTAALRRRITALYELSRTRRYEAQLGNQFERLITATPTDAWALRTLAATFEAPLRTPIHVLPNGVDLQDSAPQPVLREPHRLVISSIAAPEAAAALQFIGADLMPRLWQARADIQVTLVGVPISPALRALARDPRVTLLPVNADPRSVLSQATLAVVPPLPGIPAGLLEALATGTPVVAAPQLTRDTALRDGHELLLAGDGAAYAHAILALLDDPGYRGRLGRAGRQYVEQHHTWDDSAAEAEQIYAAALGAEIADWRLAMGLHRRMATPTLLSQ